MTENRFISKSELEKFGFLENQAKQIIKMAKDNMEKEGYGYYNTSKYIAIVPVFAVEKVLGVSLQKDLEDDGSGKN